MTENVSEVIAWLRARGDEPAATLFEDLKTEQGL